VAVISRLCRLEAIGTPGGHEVKGQRDSSGRTTNAYPASKQVQSVDCWNFNSHITDLQLYTDCTDLHTRWRGTTAACLLLTLQLFNRAFLRVDRSCVVFVLCTEMAYSVLSSRILVPLLVISMQLNHHFVNSQCKKLLPYYLHYISAKLQIIIMLCLYYDTYQRSTIRK